MDKIKYVRTYVPSKGWITVKIVNGVRIMPPDYKLK